MVRKFKDKYGENIIAGYRDGYFDHDNSSEIANEIVSKDASILLVGMTSPLQEKFLFENKEILQKVNFKMGVGGSFDVIAGKVKELLYGCKNMAWNGFIDLCKNQKNVEEILDR